MTFLTEVAQPNMQKAIERPDDLQAIVNAMLTLDALAGIIHADASASGHATVVAYEDDRYREELATVSPSFRVLRDAAASIKHGELSPYRKKARLVRRPGAFKAVPNGIGLLQCGDHSSSVVVIEFDVGPGFIRASDVIADSYRMLKRVVDGEKARTDEHDHGSFPAL